MTEDELELKAQQDFLKSLEKKQADEDNYKKQNATQIRNDFLESKFRELQSVKQTTQLRPADYFYGSINRSTYSIPVYKTDYYAGEMTENSLGVYIKSGWTAIITGMRISSDSYDDLMKVLSTLK